MIYEYENGIPAEVLKEALAKSLEGKDLKKVLILPPISPECTPAQERLLPFIMNC